MTTELQRDVRGGCSVQRLVGRHGLTATLYNADCLDVLPIEADAVVTDPPYGMNYSARQGKWPGRKAKQKDGNLWGKEWTPIQGDDKKFDPAPWVKYPLVCLWGAPHFCAALEEGKTWLVWNKTPPEKWVGVDCEIAWTNIGAGGVRMWSCLWQGFLRDREIREHYHPTQKPIDLMAWAMNELGVKAGQTVLDPYMGAGSTGIACLRTGRNFIGIERDAAHYKTAVERIRQEIDGALL
jgi:DNA modification methylase